MLLISLQHIIIEMNNNVVADETLHALIFSTMDTTTVYVPPLCLATLCLWEQRKNWCLGMLGWEETFGFWQAMVPTTMFGRKLKTSRVGRGPRSEGKTPAEVLCCGSKAVWGRKGLEMCDLWPVLGVDLQSDVLGGGLRAKERLRGTRVTPLAPRLIPKRRAFLWGSVCVARVCSDARLRQDLRTQDLFWTSVLPSCSLLGDVNVSCLFFSPTARFSLPETWKETVEGFWRDGLCEVSLSCDDDWSEGNWMVRDGLENTVCLWRGLDLLMGAPSTSRLTPTYWGTSTAAWEGDTLKYKQNKHLF